MPTPVITSRDQYKPSPIYMNGINGSNGTTTTHHLRTSRSPPCPPQLPIPMPMPPMPLGPIAHHQPHGYFQSMGPPPPPPAMAAVHPAAAAAAAAAAAQVAVSGPSPPTPHQPPPPPPPQLYATSPEQPTQSYCDYLYHVGFLQGETEICQRYKKMMTCLTYLYRAQACSLILQLLYQLFKSHMLCTHWFCPGLPCSTVVL